MSKSDLVKRAFSFPVFAAILALPALIPGCNPVVPGEPTGLAAEVATKAGEVAQRIGGAGGFGGTMMNGYMSGMPEHMGFHGTGNLAGDGERMMLTLRNDANVDATFQMAYMSSPMGVGEQMMGVTVPAGSERTIEMPCSEIVGVGSLTSVGDTAAQLADGTEFDNRMCVPGFLGTDFQCDGTYRCYLAPDVNDLDGDGDTQELIVSTEALQLHMPAGMMMGGAQP